MASLLKSVDCPEFDLTVDSDQTAAFEESGKDARDFAHHVDAYIIKVLDNPAINKVFNSLVKLNIDATFGLQLAQGVSVDSVQAPELYAVLRHCSETLRIPIPYTIISSAVQGINAMTAGADGFSFIAVSGLITALCTVDEQKFIIGHECGHLALGHVVYHTAASTMGGVAQLMPVIGPVVSKVVTFPLNAWVRRSEISADRAGLLCCGDIELAKEMLVKLELGIATAAIGNGTPVKINSDAYVNNSKRVMDKTLLGKYGELFKSHPILPKRIEALELFHNSEKYYRCSGKEAPKNVELLPDAELDRLTEDIIKILE